MGHRKVEQLKGVPWEPVPGRENIEVGIRVELQKEEVEERQEMPDMQEREVRARRFHITKAMVRKFVMTLDCPGCIALNRGKRELDNHSELCRERMTDLIAERDTKAEFERLEKDLQK